MKKDNISRRDLMLGSIGIAALSAAIRAHADETDPESSSVLSGNNPIVKGPSEVAADGGTFIITVEPPIPLKDPQYANVRVFDCTVVYDADSDSFSFTAEHKNVQGIEPNDPDNHPDEFYEYIKMDRIRDVKITTRPLTDCQIQMVIVAVYNNKYSAFKSVRLKKF